MKNRWSKLAFTSLLGLILSYTFVFIAALPIRYLRLTFGRKTFILSTVAGTAVLCVLQFWQWALVYLSLCLLIGFYRELEEKSFSIFLASSFAIFLTAGVNLLVLFGYTKITDVAVKSFLSTKAQPFLNQLQQLPRFKETNLQDLLWYLPSGVIITLMLILFISLTASKGAGQTKQSLELKMFRLPDWAIWLFILSLGLTFIPLASPLISLVAMNILAISLAAYFFQGLAVFTYFLDRFSIFGFWRMLAFFLVFFQMFIFVSGLGILDYWFDFRINTTNKLTQKTFN